MTRTATTEPLVEIDSDGSFTPAGRQLGPDRTDGRDHHGLTSPEETAYQFAIDRLNKTPDITPSSHVTLDEETTMFHEMGFTSTTPTAMKDSWVAQYRTLHPLPTAFSELAAGDPALYVPPAAPSAALVTIPDGARTSITPFPGKTWPAAAIEDGALAVDVAGDRWIARGGLWYPQPAMAAVGPTDTVPPVTTSARTTPSTPTRTFRDLAAAMNTLEEEAKRDQAPVQKAAPGVTPAAAVTSAPAAPSKLAEVIGTAVEVVEFAEAHPDAVTRLGNLLRRLFQHAA